MVGDLWGLFFIVLAGFLAGGTYTLWKSNRIVAVALGGCTALAVAAGVLRLGYL
ncbi:hypothetical protein DFP74_5546 [Nocardiopsis sp. Huas11]|uniref:hypothetical protein n=1 Tax=Nocardiopsis sp. Huas11 TaxID=2183912 RepID=UPI000F169C6F|nr:hypothetical protein [Nocardiopsis sp. Huas11]RKS09801.1 hypothetical protein DFP74_5546 [Nocardiopsis sp. Huas11]